MTPNETRIREFLESRTDAQRSKDIDRLISFYAPDIVSWWFRTKSVATATPRAACSHHPMRRNSSSSPVIVSPLSSISVLQ